MEKVQREWTVYQMVFFLMIRRPPRSTLFPYTTLLPIYSSLESKMSSTSILYTKSILKQSCSPFSPNFEKERNGNGKQYQCPSLMWLHMLFLLPSKWIFYRLELTAQYILQFSSFLPSNLFSTVPELHSSTANTYIIRYYHAVFAWENQIQLTL